MVSILHTLLLKTGLPTNVKDEHALGNYSFLTMQEHFDFVYDIIRIELDRIAEVLSIFREGVFHIFYHKFDMRKPSSKWIPRYFNVNQKRVHLTTSRKKLSDGLVLLLWKKHESVGSKIKKRHKEWKHSGSTQKN